MARSRVIKPEFWSDEKLARLSRDSRLTYVGLWTASDDYGVVKGNPVWLKGQIYPYDDVPIPQLQAWLDELKREERILYFEYHGESYYFLPKFLEHQKVDHPSKTRNPEPPADFLPRKGTQEETSSRNTRADSRESRDEENRVEENRTEKSSKEARTRAKTGTSVPEKENTETGNVLGPIGNDKRRRDAITTIREMRQSNGNTELIGRLMEQYGLTELDVRAEQPP